MGNVHGLLETNTNIGKDSQKHTGIQRIFINRESCGDLGSPGPLYSTIRTVQPGNGASNSYRAML